mgnify:CR=1 FL=1
MSLDLAALRAGYRGGDFSPAQIADDVLERIAAHDDPAVWIYRVPDADLRRPWPKPRWTACRSMACPSR